jgi:hypothetical protein
LLCYFLSVWQFTAFSPTAYWLPTLAIDPPTYALLCVRWQTSLATFGVRGVPGSRVINAGSDA